MSGLVALLMVASCLGWGAMALRLAGVFSYLLWRERMAWSFGLGMGLLGWFGFFAALAGHPDIPTLSLITVGGLVGLTGLRPSQISDEPLTPWTWTLLVLTAAVFIGDMVEGMAPPTDADSLAYHFAIPRQILQEHHLVFVPRAADGAIPLLQQMTYLVALALGNEQAMTLWCGLSGWSAAALAYVLGRRHMSRDWALAGALAVVTLPAFLYGAGSGQVEARLASFVTIAVIAALDARRSDKLGWAVVAGLAAGFSMASKYPGLLVAFLCGLTMLAQRHGLAKASLFSVVACLAGGQWYGWNWWNIGDPVFPMLYGLIPYPADAPWNSLQDAAFKEWASQIESPLSRSVTDILLYPLRVTFSPHPALDSGRTGLGSLPALLLPFAAWGGWRSRRAPEANWWMAAGLICLGYYLLWSGFGASQRVRHYLPFMPLVIIGLLAAAIRGGAGTQRALVTGLTAALLLQTAGQAVFVRNSVGYLRSGESRTAFIERNVGLAFAVTWANANLPHSAKVMINTRPWLYLLDHPALFVTKIQDARVEVRSDSGDVGRFWRQLRHQGVTHAILPHGDPAMPTTIGDSYFTLVGKVIAAGCGRVIATLSGPEPIISRAMETRRTGSVLVPIVAFTPKGCPLDRENH